jgi:carbonic anhydrase
MKATTRTQANTLSPNEALIELKQGNKRFTEEKPLIRNYKEQVAGTSAGQFPFAAILSCIDSRVPVETVFDQGIGDVFNARVAGNIVNEDILGSLEYACNVAGASLIVVLGHTKCGAVTAACQQVELGNITALLSKITPVVAALKPDSTSFTSAEIEQVALANVHHSIHRIKSESEILNSMVENGQLAIVGAVYDVVSGIVKFL